MQLLPAALSSSSVIGNIAAGLGAVTSVMSGMYQANVATMNAQIARQNAAQVKQESAVQSQMQDLEAQQEIGALLSQGASSGLDIGVGSGALRRRSAEELAARDRGFTAYQGQREAVAYKQQEAGFEAEAGAKRMGGILGGMSSLLDLSFPNLVKDASAVSPKIKAKVVGNVRPRRSPAY
jgi:hypothetical protein